jgi:hypothetical protein
MANDRTVHAVVADGWIVRYDRAGKWYLEHRDGSTRTSLTVATAARTALDAVPPARIYRNLPGGLAFDAKLKSLTASKTETTSR